MRHIFVFYISLKNREIPAVLFADKLPELENLMNTTEPRAASLWPLATS
jgi:hypothetical protein